MHTCTTCKKSFTRREYLLKHSSRCRPKPFACDVCHSFFERKDNLDRHKRTVQCGSPPQPGPSAPKRQKVTHLHEDPVTPPPIEPSNDNLSSDLQYAVRDNWGSIRTHVVHGPIQTRYNHRLSSLEMRDSHEQLRVLFDQQTTSFKINCSFAFILKEKQSGRLKYYHSSNNCCGRYLEEPSLIGKRADFDQFLERIREPDILKWAIAQRPNSDWVCEMATNVTFFINRIAQHPIGCVGIVLPPHIKRKKSIIGLETDGNGRPYIDNLCLFRCLGLYLGRDVTTLYEEYTDQPVDTFEGVTIDELHKVEATFDVNVCVYKLVATGNEKTKAEIVRRSLCSYVQTMYLNLYETHFSYIKDINMYCHSWRCRNCEQALWKCPYDLHCHERTCTEGIKRVYKGGVYRPPSSVFERLDDEGIVVSDYLRYYPYRATFDFECYFNDERLPTNTDHVEWIARHVPLSVSVASNVPGYEPAQCYITDGDSDKLVEEMMNNLIAISDTAYDALLPSYVDVLADLDARKHAWEEETKEAEEEDEEEEAENGKKTVNPYKTLENQLQVWLHQLPVVGFNSGRYDLNAIKKFFVPLLIHNNAAVIKRQNTYMCLSTDQLKFVDICNYLAPGVSYDKYLKAYGCELQKGRFPYEYMDDLQKLEDRVLPPQSAFFSRLKNEGISNDDYA